MQRRPIQIWLGALPPDFPIIGGGEQNCPRISNYVFPIKGNFLLKFRVDVVAPVPKLFQRQVKMPVVTSSKTVIEHLEATVDSNKTAIGNGRTIIKAPNFIPSI